MLLEIPTYLCVHMHVIHLVIPMITVFKTIIYVPIEIALGMLKICKDVKFHIKSFSFFFSETRLYCGLR